MVGKLKIIKKTIGLCITIFFQMLKKLYNQGMDENADASVTTTSARRNNGDERGSSSAIWTLMILSIIQRGKSSDR